MDQYNILFCSVPSGADQTQPIILHWPRMGSGYKIAHHMTISASGLIKAVILKNKKSIATLFNNSKDLNIFYPHHLHIEQNDTLEIMVTNRENVPQDIYCGLEIG